MNLRIKFRFHRATYWLAAIVVWGAWNAHTDCYPLNEQQARPSWYVYGWPVCFATSGRGRFNFVSFDTRALVFDLAISTAMVACTVYLGEGLLRRLPQFTMVDMLAIVTGFAVVSFVWSGGMYWLSGQMLGAVLPAPDFSVSAGNAQPTSRMSALIVLPTSLGLASVGFAAFRLPFDIFGYQGTRNQRMHGSGG
jgi:hypothetical protein